MLRTIVHRANWDFRTQEDQDDVGIDGEIEVVEDRDVTGWLLKVQVRGLARIPWRGATHRMLIERSTYNEWLAVGLPVVVVLGDVSTEELFWAVPYGASESSDLVAKVPITFDKTRRIDNDLTGLRRVIETWRAGHVAEPLGEVSPFLRMFRELEEGLGRDYFLVIDDEIDEKFRLFLGHLSRLHVQVGLISDVPEPTHSAWVEVSIAAFPDGDRAIYYGIYDIAIDLLRRDYYACLRRIRNRVETLLSQEWRDELRALGELLDRAGLDSAEVEGAARDAAARLHRLLQNLPPAGK